MLSNLHRQKCLLQKESNRTVLAAELYSTQTEMVEGLVWSAQTPHNHEESGQPGANAAKSSFMARLKDKDADRSLA